MRFPFISVHAHEQICDVYRHAFDAQHTQFLALQQAHVELQSMYHALRVMGANPPIVAIAPHRIDEVTQAVNAVARGDKKLRASMMLQVEKDRRNGFTDLEIIERIQRGAAPDTLEEFVS